ncbi:unnamed protein product [Brugia pahangi]|uniref:DNA-directed RNA polymerase n=1 Tax=Brugia pahangi TaxID=6280 RepID=A0A0N4T5A7_BRUPA|nr:unnamed protein product [Brugia pahangi]
MFVGGWLAAKKSGYGGMVGGISTGSMVLDMKMLNHLGQNIISTTFYSSVKNEAVSWLCGDCVQGANTPTDE